MKSINSKLILDAVNNDHEKVNGQLVLYLSKNLINQAIEERIIHLENGVPFWSGFLILENKPIEN